MGSSKGQWQTGTWPGSVLDVSPLFYFLIFGAHQRGIGLLRTSAPSGSTAVPGCGGMVRKEHAFAVLIVAGDGVGSG